MSPRDGGNDTRELARKKLVGADGLTVQTAADVRRVLGEQIAQLTANPDLDPARKARLLAQLAPATLRAIEVATLEARVAAIEAVLRRRTDQPRVEVAQANARTLPQHYSQFTPEERVRLVVAATARHDAEEIARLRDSVPDMSFVGPHPAYFILFSSLLEAVMATVLRWVDVSHRIVRASLAAEVANSFGELLIENRSRRFSEVEKAIFDQCQLWSARWKGIDSAITKFCSEAGFERDQLFATSEPDVIEEARCTLAPDVQADCDWEEYTYRTLRDAWPCQGASKQQEDQTLAAAGSKPGASS
jgi:hypothetical protein